MAVRLRKDGRWVCYYRGPDSKQKEEYFGHGKRGEAAAWRRNAELGLGKRKKKDAGLLFRDLAETYFSNKIFNENSRNQLSIRLESKILPLFGNRVVMGLKDQDLDDYVHRLHKDGLKYSIHHPLPERRPGHIELGRRPPESEANVKPSVR